MAKYVVMFICTFLSISVNAQNLNGAWEANYISEGGNRVKSIWMFADGYQTLTTYDAATGKFLHTEGGSWDLVNGVLKGKIEFNTENTEAAGTENNLEVSITDQYLQINDSHMKYKRVDNGKPGVLNGAWLMSGRVRNGETQQRDISSPRKTMKILSGTRFQWTAYNTQTKQFMGTGGGTYTTVDGEYTENIEFFSKDDSKVGLTLKFNYELLDGKWHHSGLSSKGNPIHEIWSLRE
ncbi:membrane or secreted protein [Galbibacter sp. BG1]|uniref:membrane or secreted protein n=1 Tax=Galbibacter sp. BG1 TaxID=1170699 RepID=UPI0015B9C691|nr:membrane or secreted protein [Galbibacter sp. BG1]QLE02278.1 membrane or secreted protein [Galbibacter sp. BG1]